MMSLLYAVVLAFCCLLGSASRSDLRCGETCQRALLVKNRSHNHQHPPGSPTLRRVPRLPTNNPVKKNKGHPPGKKCRNVTVSASIIQSVRRGLGHRVIDLGMTVTFAKKLGVVPALILNEWSFQGEHGGYAFFPRFAGLAKIFHMVSPLLLSTTVDIKNWSVVNRSFATGPVNFSSPCRGGEYMYRSCDRCCSSSGEMCEIKKPLLDLQKLIQPAFETQPFGSSHRFATVKSLYSKRGNDGDLRKIFTPFPSNNAKIGNSDDCISVVAHIRVGDRQLGCDFSSNRTMADLVYKVIHEIKIVDRCIEVYYVAEANVKSSCVSLLFSTHARMSDNVKAFLSIDPSVEESLKVMTAADLLLSSGSSFTRVAAVLSRWLLHITPSRFSELENDLTYEVHESEINVKLPVVVNTVDLSLGDFIRQKVHTRRMFSLSNISVASV